LGYFWAIFSNSSVILSQEPVHEGDPGQREREAASVSGNLLLTGKEL
jgi:hypothetical protein